MSQRFILDENVVIYAQFGQDEDENTDPTCMRLIEQIVEICHTLVFDPALWNRYYEQLSRPRYPHPQEGFRLVRLINEAAHMAGKIDIRSADAAEFPEEGSIPPGSQDDVELVRLAVETRATVVTTDRSLREDLNSCGVAETYRLRLLSPSEALEQL